jgi:hypothetical protein
MVISSQAVLATEGSTTIPAGSREQSRSARQLLFCFYFNKGGEVINKWTDEQKAEIIDDYTKKGMTLAEIGKKFHSKGDTISKYLKSWDIPINRRKKNRLMNEKFFSIIDSAEKSYFLGLLFADGSVVLNSERAPYVSLELVEKDKEILEIFRSLLNCQNDLYYNKRDNRKNGTYTFGVRSQLLADDLAKFNIIPNKTYETTQVIFPENFLIDFLRGYIDGDGSIYQNVYKAVWNGQDAKRIINILYLKNDGIALSRKRERAKLAQQNKS